MVEELLMDGSKRVLVSYLPWRQRLGRSEQADIVFGAILERLARVASEPQVRLPDAGLNLVWPRPSDVLESERPILYALLHRERYRGLYERLAQEEDPAIQLSGRLGSFGLDHHQMLHSTEFHPPRIRPEPIEKARRHLEPLLRLAKQCGVLGEEGWTVDSQRLISSTV